MTQEEFDRLEDKTKAVFTPSFREMRRVAWWWFLTMLPLAEQVKRASALIAEASKYADDPGLKKYLELRAEALLKDDYFMSDMAWMDMKDNVIDFVVGPIETYEDQLFGYKASMKPMCLSRMLSGAKG